MKTRPCCDGRKRVGLVDARAAVRGSMAMIGDGLDVVVDVRVEVLAALPVVDAAGDHVPQMRDHAGADQQLSLGVVVDAPRIAEAVRHHLEHVVGRMIPPDAAVDVARPRPRGGPTETAPCAGRRRPRPAGLRMFELVA